MPAHLAYNELAERRVLLQNANVADALFDRYVPCSHGLRYDQTRQAEMLVSCCRAVLNQADLRNANFERVVLTRSDLTGAKIDGTDFSNALIDKTQQIVRPACALAAAAALQPTLISTAPAAAGPVQVCVWQKQRHWRGHPQEPGLRQPQALRRVFAQQ